MKGRAELGDAGAVRLRWVLTVTAAGWACLLPVAACAAARPAGQGWHALALVVYGVGSVICHQDAERSFTLWMTQLPVCARCTGLYVGAAAVAVGGALHPLPIARTCPARLLAVAAAPTAVSLLFEWTTGIVPSHLVRALCGALLGGAVMAVLAAGIRGAAAAPPRGVDGPGGSGTGRS